MFESVFRGCPELRQPVVPTKFSADRRFATRSKRGKRKPDSARVAMHNHRGICASESTNGRVQLTVRNRYFLSRPNPVLPPQSNHVLQRRFIERGRRPGWAPNLARGIDREPERLVLPRNRVTCGPFGQFADRRQRSGPALEVAAQFFQK